MTQRTLILAAGDLFTILVFTLIGRQTHEMSAGLTALLATLQTAAPFMAGWLLTAPWLGAFRPDACKRPIRAVGVVLQTIAPALIVGALLRGLMIGRSSPFIFYLVTAAFMLALLSLWRLFFCLVLAPRLAR